jgi:hypothetical protein
MPYYTHHRYKGTHDYVCVYVLSDCSYDCMPYYILHINIDAHPYIYYRNVRIQHCVHEVLHSEYPGKKAQRLNIRIYSDRTVTFIGIYTVNKNPLPLKSCVIYKSVLVDKQFVKLISECYMKCIVEHPFNNLGKLELLNILITANNTFHKRLHVF